MIQNVLESAFGANKANKVSHSHLPKQQPRPYTLTISPFVRDSQCSLLACLSERSHQGIHACSLLRKLCSQSRDLLPSLLWYCCRKALIQILQTVEKTLGCIVVHTVNLRQTKSVNGKNNEEESWNGARFVLGWWYKHRHRYYICDDGKKIGELKGDLGVIR